MNRNLRSVFVVVFAEMKYKSPILKGMYLNESDQLRLTYELCGTPTSEVLELYQTYPW